MVTSRLGLQLRAMPGFVDLLWPESVLISVAPDTIEGYADNRYLGHHLGLCWCLRASLPRKASQSDYVATWGHGVFWARATAEGYV